MTVAEDKPAAPPSLVYCGKTASPGGGGGSAEAVEQTTDVKAEGDDGVTIDGIIPALIISPLPPAMRLCLTPTPGGGLW